MTSLDDTRTLQAVDSAFHYSGLVLRACGYLVIAAIAQQYAFGAALLTGVLAGDLLGQLLKAIVNFRDNPIAWCCELLLLGLIYLLSHALLVWPDDSAMRAIIGLAGFAALSGHIGGSMLTHFGPAPS